MGIGGRGGGNITGACLANHVKTYLVLVTHHAQQRVRHFAVLGNLLQALLPLVLADGGLISRSTVHLIVPRLRVQVWRHDILRGWMLGEQQLVSHSGSLNYIREIEILIKFGSWATCGAT